MRKRRAYLTIGEAAQVLGVSASSLRNWERIGLINPLRSQGRYRLFSRETLEQAKRIRYLRDVKLMNPHAILHFLDERTAGNGAKRLATKQAKGGRAQTIGSRLARLRQQENLTLSAVAQRAGVSASFLSAIERDQANPSIATLQKLATLYNTNVVSFFGNSQAPRRLVRPRDRKQLCPQPGIRIEQLAVGRTMMETQLWTIAPGAGSGGSYHHEGEEFIYVLKGTLEVWLDELERYLIGPGDSLYFESTHAHRWTNPGDKETVLLWVNTPPTF